MVVPLDVVTLIFWSLSLMSEAQPVIKSTLAAVMVSRMNIQKLLKMDVMVLGLTVQRFLNPVKNQRPVKSYLFHL
jgi:hypothetical protein